MQQEPCPICDLELIEQGSEGSTKQYSCRRCGKFLLTMTARIVLQHELTVQDRRRAALSHQIRRMQRENEWPLIDSEIYAKLLLKQGLPRPPEQSQSLLLWLGKQSSYAGESIIVSCEELQATIGALTPESVYFVALQLQHRGLLDVSRTDNTKPAPPLAVQLTLSGWDEIERLQKNITQSRTAFMAFKFGDTVLDEMVDNVFRKAVTDTGFELKVLSDPQPAGLIDDNIRVEIRRSRFLIADLTHVNPGAYWESGFAEGLGIPVIYTCEAQAFKSGASHFDTNHHLTVTWDADKHAVAERLKATIRATLPSEAKLRD